MKPPVTQAPSSTLWTSLDAARATGGTTTRDWFATGVSIDTRTLKQGDLFIAIQGETVDGHDHVAAALNNGAVAAVVNYIPADVDPERVLVVEDTLVAMNRLSEVARLRSAAKVIAITGASGKTPARVMLSEAFSVIGQTHWSDKDHKDVWNVPLAFSRMHGGSDFAVVEMGVSSELARFSAQSRPHVAIVTTLKPEQIDDASKVFSGMEPHGLALLNRDIEQYKRLETLAYNYGLKKVYGFGTHPDADARLLDTIVASNGIRVTAQIMGERIAFTLRPAALHTVMNALATLLCVRLIHGDMKDALRALEGLDPLAGRGRHEILVLGDPKNPVTLIDESYNASPVAMQAAFKVMALIDPGRGGRRIAILGDMLELGDRGAKTHADLALPLKAANVDLVYTCGPLMKNLYDNLAREQQGAHESSSVELGEIVPDVLRPGDVVLIKGSSESKMNVVVEALRALPAKRKVANANG